MNNIEMMIQKINTINSEKELCDFFDKVEERYNYKWAGLIIFEPNPNQTYRIKTHGNIPEKLISFISVDKNILDQINLDPGGVCVTSIGDNSDFVSRFFTPQSSILEDPVTGSAHCSLVPYWSDILNKDILQALQISQRGGLLSCENKGNRVIIGGKANTFFKETLRLNSII